MLAAVEFRVAVACPNDDALGNRATNAFEGDVCSDSVVLGVCILTTGNAVELDVCFDANSEDVGSGTIFPTGNAVANEGVCCGIPEGRWSAGVVW